MTGEGKDPMTKESYMLRWIAPSLVPTTITSTALLSFGSNGRKMASRDCLELNTSSLYPYEYSTHRKSTVTYELPAAARTLSFGKLVSISMRDKSRGKSRGVFSPDKIPSLVKKLPQELESFPALTELELLFVRLVAHPKQVTPEAASPVVNWCTILPLSAPTRRTDPSPQAIANSFPIHKSVSLMLKTFSGGQLTIWFPSKVFYFQLSSLLSCTIYSLTIETINENLLVYCNESNQVHRRAVGDKIRICRLVKSLLAHDLKNRRTFHAASGKRIFVSISFVIERFATCSASRHGCTPFQRGGNAKDAEIALLEGNLSEDWIY
jgi:hypothetical protein